MSKHIKPFRCKIGLHKWHSISAYQSTDFPNEHKIVEECPDCLATRSSWRKGLIPKAFAGNIDIHNTNLPGSFGFSQVIYKNE